MAQMVDLPLRGWRHMGIRNDAHLTFSCFSAGLNVKAIQYFVCEPVQGSIQLTLIVVWI